MNKDDFEEKKVLSVKISRNSAEGWWDFCAHHGISVTAFLEVSGLELANETIPDMVTGRNRLIAAARNIDIERRSRKRRYNS